MKAERVAGKRGDVDLDTGGRRPDPTVVSPGQYMKRADGTGWDAMTPAGLRVFLPAASVTEHEDGSISAATIKVERTHPPIDRDGKTVTKTTLWQGAIVAGDWRETPA